MDKVKLIVTTASGIEAVTKRELFKLGIESKAINGRFTFNCDIDYIAKLNINLRTADRVLLCIKEFTAYDFDMLFDNIINSNIYRFLNKDSRILIRTKCTKSELHSVPAVTSVAKKAIIENMKRNFHINNTPESGNDIYVDLNIFKDNVQLSINTSGIGLHKRGYRDLVWKAPLKETIASAIIQLSIWHKEKTLIDPFCGSGTIPIEAGMIANNIPSGLNRQFTCENWNTIDQNMFKLEREKAKDNIINFPFKIYGSDINPKAIELSKHHAENVGLNIDFNVCDVKNIKSDDSYGVIVSNPPYGERLMTEKEIKQLYKTIYNSYNKLDKFSMYVLTSNSNLEKYFGKKAMRNRKLYNGNVQCRLYNYLGPKPIKSK